ncbi:MAG: FHA domain-containing protein [Granulosicoccus sp.]
MSATPRQLTILFADIGGSAALYERVGDAEGYRLVAASLTLMKAAIERHGGEVLRTVGDSVLASFINTDDAFLGARDIQRGHLDLPLSIRVGFHPGPVIPDGGDIYGHAVNVAARVAAFARIDEVMATAAAVAQLSAKYRVFASQSSTIDVRGVPDAIEIHRLQWQEQASAVTQLASSEPAVSVDLANSRLRLEHGSINLNAGASLRDVSLGRAEDNDIAVLNDEASRHHARIAFRRGQFVLHDDSTNGTYVQKDSLLPFLVRRDSIVLDGRGLICLGAPPSDEDIDVIRFELVYD